MGGKSHLKLNIGWETDSEQVPWGKDEKNFEKRVKRPEIVEREAVEIYCFGGERWLLAYAHCTVDSSCHRLRLVHGDAAGCDLRREARWGSRIRKGLPNLADASGSLGVLVGTAALRDAYVRFCQNGFYRPVLKHGPRSLTYMRVWGWRNPCAEWKWDECARRKPAASTDQDLLVKGLSMSISVRTRKMVNYAWVGWSQGKLWWRLVAVLTCKSFVKLGYRGERLIEPSSSWFPPNFPQDSWNNVHSFIR